ncbi:MAG: phosphoglycerate mutase (2,3-diphosphoglycerate-independent) [Alphaproteobacteria bacterium]|nr:phosphoglycerate mutase (2,3-diphosphoglycerate-independent) [Alphaproteobacteria bacterium]
MKKKVLLCILDGWGISEESSFNAISEAKTNNFDKIIKKYGMIKLFASEDKVGLPEGQFGNSEVGHMNIGAGRVILQDILRIDKGLMNGYIENHESIKEIQSNCERIHLCGILSDGGVHGHQDHFFKMIRIFEKSNKEVLLHCFLDGRDSSPISGLENMKKLNEIIKKNKKIKVVSVCGRFFSMDRDNRWDRIEKAYKVIIEGNGEKKKDCIKAIQESYLNKVTDEFFKPINLDNYDGVKQGDGFFITNYRADRVRELLTAIFDENFTEFNRKKVANFFKPTSMIEYSKRLKKKISSIIKPLIIKKSLGEILSTNDLNQLRITETEKYAHVTYFFNGGIEETFNKEQRVLIPSPRVETYDKKPEMSAFELTSELEKNIELNKYEFILTNFANPDMVGHTGNLKATIKAIEVVDKCLGRILKKCIEKNYILIVTSDHGNADLMFDEIESIKCTTHSINPVPFIICDDYEYKYKVGTLADIAPTILKIMNIDAPEEMEGKVLIE